MRYTIEEIKGRRVVKRRKSEEARSVVTSKLADGPKMRRVVTRRIPVAPVQAAPPVEKRSNSAKASTKAAKAAGKTPHVEKPVPLYRSGQNGPAIDLDVCDLNEKESGILGVLNASGRGARPQLTITELASGAFSSENSLRGMSWVRNSLRRLVRSGYVEKCARGCYRVTDTGRRRLFKAA